MDVRTIGYMMQDLHKDIEKHLGIISDGVSEILIRRWNVDVPDDHEAELACERILLAYDKVEDLVSEYNELKLALHKRKMINLWTAQVEYYNLANVRKTIPVNGEMLKYDWSFGPLPVPKSTTIELMELNKPDGIFKYTIEPKLRFKTFKLPIPDDISVSVSSDEEEDGETLDSEEESDSDDDDSDLDSFVVPDDSVEYEESEDEEVDVIESKKKKKSRRRPASPPSSRKKRSRILVQEDEEE
jgi:hypothetical protein